MIFLKYKKEGKFVFVQLYFSFIRVWIRNTFNRKVTFKHLDNSNRLGNSHSDFRKGIKKV
jgi:hypothetical protein